MHSSPTARNLFLFLISTFRLTLSPPPPRHLTLFAPPPPPPHHFRPILTSPTPSPALGVSKAGYRVEIITTIRITITTTRTIIIIMRRRRRRSRHPNRRHRLIGAGSWVGNPRTNYKQAGKQAFSSFAFIEGRLPCRPAK